uniref:Uncharacterized protein n=1 Tax=Hyaloperonospora arabidopsidis (strain Emoy2) TaxID=559515 RepID=M4C2P7_HYAAE
MIHPEEYGLTLLGPNEQCGYLGIQVRQGDTTYSNWDRCFRALYFRLVLAREKTHTVEQHACLARDIAIPKVNYVARDCWPPPVIILKLQGFITDFVWGKRNGRRSRPWVQEEHEALSIREGGHAGGRNAQAVRTRANRFVAKTTVTHSDHGGVTVDARALLDGPNRNELLEETSAYGRFETTWMKHASMETMPWHFDRKGRRYQRNAGLTQDSGTFIGSYAYRLTWAGHQQWRPCCKAIKTSIFRGRHREGELQRDKRVIAKDHRVVSRGADLIEWTELRRTKDISRWSRRQSIVLRNRSCPNPACSPGTYGPASHVFWNCPAAQVYWRRLLDLSCPRAVWAVAKTGLTAKESTKVAQASVFAAANELWRFVVASKPTQSESNTYVRCRTQHYCRKSTKAAPCPFKKRSCALPTLD